jgi:diguanylate cyclase (GGDEF)-like protein
VTHSEQDIGVRDVSSGKTDPLTELLDSLPIGISAKVAGVTFYQNRLGVAHGDLAGSGDVLQDDRTIKVEKLTLNLFDADCEVRLSRDVTEQRELEDKLFRRAYFDELTGLPNRELIELSCQRLIGAVASKGQFAIAFIDIDNFKNINDYYGHGAGDQMLVKLAEIVSSTLKPTDMLARVGGDEFVLLLSSIESREALEGAMRQLLDRIKAPLFVDGYEIFTSASIGVSLYPEHGGTYQELCSSADRAMYRTKALSKGSVQFYDGNVSSAATTAMNLEQRLRLAIRDKQVSCVYQPKVDFRSDEIVGVEVLLRWRDQEGVIHPPGNFVNLAVELGLMDEITHLVLAEVLDSVEGIDAAFGPQATINLNIAAKQADEPAFMRSLLDVISGSGLARRFMLELTEEAFLARTRFQNTVLPMIRDVGVRVSIDDFGSGYSSLAALADITADELKVDRSFITNIDKRPRSQSIIKAIESLAQSLGMSLLVEGVETLDELLYLKAATRIRLAQGYLFARPALLHETPKRGAGRSEGRAEPSPRNEARLPQASRA